MGFDSRIQGWLLCSETGEGLQKYDRLIDCFCPIRTNDQESEEGLLEEGQWAVFLFLCMLA